MVLGSLYWPSQSIDHGNASTLCIHIWAKNDWVTWQLWKINRDRWSRILPAPPLRWWMTAPSRFAVFSKSRRNGVEAQTLARNRNFKAHSGGKVLFFTHLLFWWTRWGYGYLVCGLLECRGHFQIVKMFVSKISIGGCHLDHDRDQIHLLFCTGWVRFTVRFDRSFKQDGDGWTEH